jgi:tetratricopeptide (TPR) repeat protein
VSPFKDKRGLAITVADDVAADAHDALTDAYLGFRIDTGGRLKTALTADPEAPLHQPLAGYIFHLMVQKPLLGRAASASQKATAIAEAKGNPREKLHAEALAAWTAGNIRGAVNHLEAILQVWPLDVLALKLAHYLHFYLGDITEHRDSVARVFPAWTEDMPGYAAVLGMRAFGLEEAGDYVQAERCGRRAVEMDPSDTWSIHAVAHVLEMQGRYKEGIAWIERDVEAWQGKVHNFANHVWWHKALYHLELGDAAAVLDLYDNSFRSEDTDDGLDIANAASMLMRLKVRDIDCGDRWDRLADVTTIKAQDHILPFNDLHTMLVLAGGDCSETLPTAAAMAAFSAQATDYWGQVYRNVGAPMARGIAAYGAGDYDNAVKELGPVRYAWGAIGGSHAQRDVFQQILIDAALRAGDNRYAQALLAERAALKPNSADTWARSAQAAAGLGQTDTAAQFSAQANRLLAG